VAQGPGPVSNRKLRGRYKELMSQRPNDEPTADDGVIDHLAEVASPESAEIRPLLGESQLNVLGGYGSEFAVQPGDQLFTDGDEAYDLIVVLEGQVDIVERFGQPGENVVIGYGPREFLGELGLLTGQRVFLTAVVRERSRILRIPVERLRVIMANEADLSEYILRTLLLRHVRLTQRGSGLTLVGSRFDPNTRRLLEVLGRNRLAFRWFELESMPEAEEILRQLDVPHSDLPLVIAPGSSLLFNPTSHALLGSVGLTVPKRTSSQTCDLLVVGAGPSGLAAGVYGASEGLSTVLIESTAIGGQAGTSSRIENYLGFPAGLSGEELAARAALQAAKFGVRMRLSVGAESMFSDGDSHHVRLEDGEVIAARSVIIATGARYRRLAVERLADFEGVGVYYAATQMEAQACSKGPVVVIGGGNSAGQAALFLARHCTHVTLVIRAESLKNSMSSYLIDQIDGDVRIDIATNTEVVGLVGEQLLEGLALRNNTTGQTYSQPTFGLFVFIGASPCTQWVNGQLAMDDHGFLLTGTDVPALALENPGQTPLLLETSRLGVFCVGDARSRSIKRMATAIGEGSTAVRMVFDRLGTTGLATVEPEHIHAAPRAYLSDGLTVTP
jgi:thioredoxin reductase (NADPH)